MDQLNTYILQLRNAGLSDELIRQQLLASGWDSRQVDESLLATLLPKQNHRARKLLLFVTLVALMIIAGVGGWFMFRRADESPPQPTPVINTEKKPEPGVTIQDAVNKYCNDIAAAYGFRGVTKGYIISERYSEAVLSGSPGILRFKQVDNAAAATVDCESDNTGAWGISNDLLFIKENNKWSYVAEVQNNAGTGFTCEVLEKYNVSKNLIASCAPSEGQPAEPRP